ncbi:hypothetical protein EVAR_15010_1 [Eumeta japonica]|uniref:Uncharacterized protein n=1 Tax=Eumeta variegata TaxID=151549 RepID=A0A4C1X9H2_EUMVA|nr:hypothetical protein EVAR_15010_1 [Eumeta japonica]
MRATFDIMICALVTKEVRPKWVPSSTCPNRARAAARSEFKRNREPKTECIVVCRLRYDERVKSERVGRADSTARAGRPRRAVAAARKQRRWALPSFAGGAHRRSSTKERRCAGDERLCRIIRYQRVNDGAEGRTSRCARAVRTRCQRNAKFADLSIKRVAQRAALAAVAEAATALRMCK